MELAPIVLFIYNRAWHTEKTLEALSQNNLADQSTLYIYADGPKDSASEADLAEIAATRQVAHKKQWCKEVHIIESDKNKGLADSIVEGVTAVVNQYGKVIVLEDDITTSKGFLQYMNDALNLYAEQPNVMHISGFLPQQFPNAKQYELPETFFLTFMSCWGWATWKDAWAKINLDTGYLLEEINKENKLNAFNLDGAISFHQQLEWNLQGKMKTWAIKWFTSIFLEGGLCLYPKQTLVRNIGFDGSGENSGELYNNPYEVSVTNFITVSPIPIEESAIGREYLRNFYLFTNKKTLKGFLVKVKNKIKQWIGHEIHAGRE
ncbi:hypothetical protein V6R21_27245 [Limibacter armeniacum]|uniref:hypothetical protein n=1 Tax=Limibacter armeniacum TaxID=466084 RepID=UPI002FE54D64